MIPKGPTAPASHKVFHFMFVEVAEPLDIRRVGVEFGREGCVKRTNMDRPFGMLQ